MDLPPEMPSLLTDFDPSADGDHLSPPLPKQCRRRRRGAQPRNADALKPGLSAASHSEANPSGSLASAGDCLQEAITRLRAVIEHLDRLYQAAESLDDKIKLSSALGVAAVRLSTLLRTQKYLAQDSRSDLEEAFNQAIYEVNKEWGRI